MQRARGRPRAGRWLPRAWSLALGAWGLGSGENLPNRGKKRRQLCFDKHSLLSPLPRSWGWSLSLPRPTPAPPTVISCWVNGRQRLMLEIFNKYNKNYAPPQPLNRNWMFAYLKSTVECATATTTTAIQMSDKEWEEREIEFDSLALS